MKREEKKLKYLRNKMFEYYDCYREGKISKQDYIFKIKPLDRKIDMIELAIFQHSRCEKRDVVIE